MIRNLKKMNQEEFARDLNLELNKKIHDGQTLQELYDCLISPVETTLDMYAPMRECTKTVRSNHLWFDHDAKKLKLQRRIAEKCWLKSRTTADRTHYMHINKCHLKHLYQRTHYINMQLESSNNKSQMLIKILQQLTKGQHDNPLPDSSSREELANKFAVFFITKVKKIRSQFQHSNLYTPPSWNCANLTQFRPIREEETLDILKSMKKTTCHIGPCNIYFLIEFKEVLLSAWTKIINTSLLNGSFLQPWNKAVVRPLIKSSNLDREFKNYWPISNLSFISKSIQKAAFLSTYFWGSECITYLPKYLPQNTIQQKLQY